MQRTRRVRPVVCLALGLAVLALGASTAEADGEAGIVVVWDDGTTSSICVPFEGDSIDGADLMAAAGFATNEFSGLVCSINDVGCTHNGTFNSCLCQCQTGSSDCIYWSFFTRDYDEPWVYSPLGYRSVSSTNGGLQAWQWLPASSAVPPAPPSATFEDVCGHPPLTTASPPPVSTLPPTPASTLPAGSPTLLPSATTTASVTSVPTFAVTSPPAGTPTATATPAPPSSGDSGAGADGSSAWLRFGAVTAVLVLAMVGLLVLRGRHGS